MNCICSKQIFLNLRVPIIANSITYCCAPGASVINGTCGCDGSATANADYIAAGFFGAPNFNQIPENPLPNFVCNTSCPANLSKFTTTKNG